MDKRYADQVALLVAILPLLDAEPRFALKGGTAINLFEHDLPRLSVDIDLTWLPMQDFDTDATQIHCLFFMHKACHNKFGQIIFIQENDLMCPIQ